MSGCAVRANNRCDWKWGTEERKESEVGYNRKEHKGDTEKAERLNNSQKYS